MTSTGRSSPRIFRSPSTGGAAPRAHCSTCSVHSLTIVPLPRSPRSLRVCHDSLGRSEVEEPSMTEHRPWFASYPDDVPKTLEPYPEKSLFSILEESASRFPDRPALAWFGRHVSYRELLRETERFSGVLASLGVHKGDRVGLILPNCPQYVIAYYATVRLGAIIVGNNPLYSERELTHQLNDAGIDVVVVLDQLYPNLEAIEDEYRPREAIVTGLEDYMPFPKNLLAPFVVFRRQAKKEGRPWPAVPKGAGVKRWKALMDSI